MAVSKSRESGLNNRLSIFFSRWMFFRGVKPCLCDGAIGSELAEKSSDDLIERALSEMATGSCSTRGKRSWVEYGRLDLLFMLVVLELRQLAKLKNRTACESVDLYIQSFMQCQLMIL
jgi:hypothetical protein